MQQKKSKKPESFSVKDNNKKEQNNNATKTKQQTWVLRYSDITLKNNKTTTKNKKSESFSGHRQQKTHKNIESPNKNKINQWQTWVLPSSQTTWVFAQQRRWILSAVPDSSQLGVWRCFLVLCWFFFVSIMRKIWSLRMHCKKNMRTNSLVLIVFSP